MSKNTEDELRRLRGLWLERIPARRRRHYVVGIVTVSGVTFLHVERKVHGIPEPRLIAEADLVHPRDKDIYSALYPVRCTAYCKLNSTDPRLMTQG